VVTVGGSAVGQSLLVTVMEAYPRLLKDLDGLQMMVVAGPRVDLAQLPRHDGVEVRGFVADLPLHLAACDVAIVQGGLTTTMELVALRRPFVYVPLGQHFEQQRHVCHRLDRHGAGRCLQHVALDPDTLADAVVEQLSSTCEYQAVPSDGAARAASMLAELI
jgi:predicted glycosyltransferase